MTDKEKPRTAEQVNTSQTGKVKLPHFKTIEQESDFWDTHSPQDFVKNPKLKRVIAHKNCKTCRQQIRAELIKEIEKNQCTLKLSNCAYYYECDCYIFSDKCLWWQEFKRDITQKGGK